VVLTVGETAMVGLTTLPEGVCQVYDVAPEPVKVTEAGAQTVLDEAEATTVGVPTLTCTVEVLEPLQ